MEYQDFSISDTIGATYYIVLIKGVPLKWSPPASREKNFVEVFNF